MGKYIFRKIGGRIVPILIGSEKSLTHTPGLSARKITAKIGKAKDQVAAMTVMIRHDKKHANIAGVKVEEKFREHGISKAMFEHAQKLLGRIDRKFIRTSWIEHEAQIKVRAGAGKSAFVHVKEPRAGGDPVSKKISIKAAYDAVQNIRHKGELATDIVKATTMIPKKFRRKK